MKSVTLLFKNILPIFLAMFATSAIHAQKALPSCSGVGAGAFYYVSAGEIWKMDTPSIVSSYPIGIFMPTSSSTSLAVSANLNGAGPSPTFYTVSPSGILKYMHYWNGTTWVSTGHIMNADHIGAGGPYIFGLDEVNAIVYRYDGTGNSVIVNSGIGNVSSVDIAADCSGNFYLINQIGTPANMRKYNSSGTLVTTYSLAGTVGAGAGGFAINGNEVYYDGADGKLYSGILSGTTVTFSASTAAPFSGTGVADDFASCGYLGFGNATGSRDTLKFCGGARNAVLRGTGPGPYNWTVISGPGKITGTGSTVTINADTTTTVVNLNQGCNGASTVPDTTVVYVARAIVNAGPDHIVNGCHGDFLDTLCGSLTGTSDDILYEIEWGPLGTILSGDRDTCPVIIAPTDTTDYYMNVKTITGCLFTDTVRVYTVDRAPKADFTWITQLGCEQDTVRFINKSFGVIDSVHWDFNDTTESVEVSPIHIYKDQGIYSVLLHVSNQYCLDTIRKFVNILHPNIAAFDVNDSTVCANQQVQFINRSTITPPITYRYIFGDGDESNLANVSHTYTRPGTYRVQFIITNGLGCIDTAFKTIVVDSLPFVNILTRDTNICEGQAVNLVADYLGSGNTSFTVDLGDGTLFNDVDSVRYAFASAGTYTVTLTARYRICDDAVYNKTIFVRPFPGVNLGPDTVLCPNGQPVILTDRVNNNNPAAKYLWNTGDTTASIRAKDIGTFWARVTLDGCSGTDSVVIAKDCYVDIPNSFTPNGDGNNDYFLPRQFLSRSLNSFKMSVFNRWGQVIYESSTIGGRGWDGKFNDKDQPQGVYVYIIDVSFDNGVKEHYTGNVTLLR